MTLYNLVPQTFGSTAKTQLPEIDFVAYALNQLPQVYRNATNFVSLITTIAHQKQAIYDIIRSLNNVPNLNDAGNPDYIYDDAAPQNVNNLSAGELGPYAEMIASVFNTQFTNTQSTDTITNLTQLQVTFVNSRGRLSDFYNYFYLKNISSYFTNYNMQEIGNATILFNIPLINNPTLSPNPYSVFINDTLKLKGAGILVIVNAANVPYFQYGALPTDPIPYEVAPGNTGYGILSNNQGINAGFYSSL